MDDKAQTTMEYMVLVAVLVAIAAIVALLAGSLFPSKAALEENNDLYYQEAMKMLK